MDSALPTSILSLHYAPESSGNAPYATALANHLAHAGALGVVVTTRPHYPQWKVHPHYAGRPWPRDSGLARVIRRRHYVPNPPRGLRRLASEVSFGLASLVSPWGRATSIVLVSPAMFASAIASLRARVPWRPIPHALWVQDIYTLGLIETGQNSGLVGAVTRRVEAWLLTGATRVVVIHERFKSACVELFNVDPDRIVVIPNWSHLEFERSQLDIPRGRMLLGASDSEFIVLHAGNMGVKQGLGNVVEAARLSEGMGLPLRFVLLGDGAEREALESKGSGCSNISFVDPLPDRDFVNAMAAADVLLVNELPELRDMSVPSKLTSYFATGVPVVAAVSSEGITGRHLMAHGTGAVVPPGDPRALVSELDRLRQKPTERAALGHRGTEFWANRLGPESALREWDRVIDQLRA